MSPASAKSKVTPNFPEWLCGASLRQHVREEITQPARLARDRVACQICIQVGGKIGGRRVSKIDGLLQTLQADHFKIAINAADQQPGADPASCSTTIINASTGLVAWNGGRPVRHS